MLEKRFSSLLAAPHRAMFFSGIALLLGSFALWAVTLAARVAPVPAINWQYPPGWMHALLVSSGALPFFIFCFALTAMPRWQGYGDIEKRDWLWPWRCLAIGWLSVIAGFFVPGLLLVGVSMVALGWLGLLRIFWRIVTHASADSRHAKTVGGAIAAGWVAVLLWLTFFLTGRSVCAQAAVSINIWWFLLPVFMTVSHRMVPFFSGNVVRGYVVMRPYWALGVIVAGSVAHGALAIAGLTNWLWLADMPAAVTAVWLSWRWWDRTILRNRLLAMLHIGFAWLGVALLMSALQSFAGLNDIFILGYAPLHILGVGFFGSLVLAMVSRVTLGHSGRPLQADRLTWGLFLGLQPVVILRAVADSVYWPWAGYLMLAAVALWLALFIAWACRYAPVYWKPRLDGRPG